MHLGNELIKQVVDALRHENDHLKTFATLSPLPGFRAWLRTQVDDHALTPAEEESLGADAGALVGAHRPLVDRRPDPRRASCVPDCSRPALATS